MTRCSSYITYWLSLLPDCDFSPAKADIFLEMSLPEFLKDNLHSWKLLKITKETDAFALKGIQDLPVLLLYLQEVKSAKYQHMVLSGDDS